MSWDKSDKVGVKCDFCGFIEFIDNQNIYTLYRWSPLCATNINLPISKNELQTNQCATYMIALP